MLCFLSIWRRSSSMENCGGRGGEGRGRQRLGLAPRSVGGGKRRGASRGPDRRRGGARDVRASGSRVELDGSHRETHLRHGCVSCISLGALRRVPKRTPERANAIAAAACSRAGFRNPTFSDAAPRPAPKKSKDAVKRRLALRAHTRSQGICDFGRISLVIHLKYTDSHT